MISVRSARPMYAWAALLAVVAMAGLPIMAVGGIRLAGHMAGVQCGGKPIAPGMQCHRAGHVLTYDQLRTAHEHLLASSVDLLATGFELTLLGTFLALLMLIGARRLHRRRQAWSATAPPAVLHAAAAARLGQFRRAYPRSVRFATWGTVLVAACTSLLVLGALVHAITPLSVGADALVLVALLGSHLVARTRTGVYLFEQGIVVAPRPLSKITSYVVPWSTVTEVYAHESVDDDGTVVHRRYRLIGKGFGDFVLDDGYADLPDLAAHLLPAIAAAQLPQAMARLRTRRTLRFGEQISGNHDGLTVQGHRVAWTDVRDIRPVRIDDIAIPVSDGGTVRVPQSQVANLGLLRLLANEPAPTIQPQTSR